MGYSSVLFISLTGIITFLALLGGAVYFAGYGDDVAEWWAKRYYKAKAIAEVKVLENVGEEKVQGMVKGMFLSLSTVVLSLPRSWGYSEESRPATTGTSKSPLFVSRLETYDC